MPACKIVLWTVCSGNVLLRFHFHWTYHYFLWYLNNCKANNYSSSCSDLPPPQRQISHIRCQHRQTLYDLQSLVGQFICSSQPWIINQVSYSVSCCCAIDDEDASATSSCSCLAGDFCLHSYIVWSTYLLANGRCQLNFAIHETMQDTTSALVFGSYLHVMEPNHHTLRYQHVNNLYTCGYQAPNRGHPACHEPPGVMRVEVCPVQETLRGYKGTSVLV